jgi:hypothetical protein
MFNRCQIQYQFRCSSLNSTSYLSSIRLHFYVNNRFLRFVAIVCTYLSTFPFIADRLSRQLCATVQYRSVRNTSCCVELRSKYLSAWHICVDTSKRCCNASYADLCSDAEHCNTSDYIQCCRVSICCKLHVSTDTCIVSVHSTILSIHY